MPCTFKKSSYHPVSCSSEAAIQSRTELCLENQDEPLINPGIHRRHEGGIKEHLLRKISIWKHINLPRWNKLLFTKQHGSCRTGIKCKPYCGIEHRSEQKGGRGGVDGNGSSFFNYVSASAADSFIDGNKTKSSANRLKIIVSRKKLGSSQQKTSYFNILPWRLNHRSSLFTSGYSTLAVVVFLCSVFIFDTHDVFVKGKK